MKITCPNCQKNYTIDPDKIPPGLKSAKCKACGGSIPFKQTAAATPPPDTAVIKRACMYCGQVHILYRDTLAPDALTIDCKSCKRPVALKLDQPADPAGTLKKEAAYSSPVQSAPRPDVQPSQPPDILTITCSGCTKSYRVQREKLPPTVKALKCKACGHRIELPAATGEPASPQSAPSVTTQVIELPGPDLRRYVLAAGIILAVVLGVFSGYKYFRGLGTSELAPVTAEQKAAAGALMKVGPFLKFDLNIPLAMDLLNRRVAKDEDARELRATMALANSLRLKRVEIYLYEDSNDRILPVILARHSDTRHLDKQLASQESFKKYFERISTGNFRLKTEVLDKADLYNFPSGPYQLTIADNGAVLAPLSFSGPIRADKNLLLETEVSRIARSISSPNDLACLAARVPADIQEGWEEKIQENPSLKKNPQTARFAGISAGTIAQLTDALEGVDVMALGFGFSGQNGRILSYAQQFQEDIDGEAIFRALDSGSRQGVEVDSVTWALVGILQDRRYKHDLQFAENRLDLEFSWLKEDDQVFLTALSETALGEPFAEFVSLTPTPEPVPDEALVVQAFDESTVQPLTAEPIEAE